MRIIFTLFISTLLSFSASAELNIQEQKIADMMVSGNLSQLKVAAKRIREGDLNNPELLDIATEVLLRKYENALPSESDTLAWLARAIGVSENGRYHSALSQVVGSASDNRLLKHAKKALKDLGDAKGEQYKLGMYKLPEGVYEQEDNSARDKRLLALLDSGSLVNLKQVAQEVATSKVQAPKVLDTIAEILLKLHASASEHQIDTLAWAASALGQAKNGRYYYVLEQTDKNGSHRKLRKYADRALDTHGQAKGEQYKAGMLGKAVGDFDF